MSLPGNAAARAPRIALLAICLGYFMVILDTTVVNVALVDIQRQLGATVSALQWVVDGYVLVFASLLLTAGALGDRLGGKRVFVAGLALFTLASALCSVSPTLGALQASRAVQGIGAALLVPASLALLSHAFPVAEQRSRAIGIWGGVAGVAAALGPVVGGLLVHVFGWRSVFLVNVPVGALAILLTLRYVPTPPRLRQRGADLAGQVAGIAALGLLTFACIEGGSLGWRSPAIAGAFVGAALAAALFVRAERRTASPMLPLGLFRSPTFSAASTVGLLLNFAIYGELFCLSLYFQQVRGDSALVTGLALLPLVSCLAIGSYISGRAAARFGPRVPMAAGQAIGGAGLLALVLVGGGTDYAALCIPLAASGFGMALAMPAMTSAVIDAAPRERAGVASAALNAARQVGTVIGVALLGSLVADRAQFLPGFHVAMAIAAAAFLCGCVLTLAVVHRGRAVGEVSPGTGETSPAARRPGREAAAVREG